MAGQKPRQGWVYWLNPHQVVLKCQLGHAYLYQLPAEIICKCDSCQLPIDPSKFLRGIHPYVVWCYDRFVDQDHDVETIIVMPLASRERNKGLPTAYPVRPTARNGLDRQGYVLVHQLLKLSLTCFKDANGNWKPRIGQLDRNDKQEIAARIEYLTEIAENPQKDWFLSRVSPQIKQILFHNLPLIDLIDIEKL